MADARLATDDFSAAEVEAVLRGPALRWDVRWELCDATGRRISDLPEGTVTAATIEHDVDREVKGSLDLEMLPVEGLADAILAFQFKPYVRIEMPSGGLAEYPQGRFVWTKPDRSLVGEVVDDDEPGAGLTITMGDQCHLLDLNGPDVGGYKANRGDRRTDLVKQILVDNGIADTSGVVDSEDELEDTLWWAQRTPRKRARKIRQRNKRNKPAPKFKVEIEDGPTTWLQIINELLDDGGYYSLFFDGDGVAQAIPSVDFSGSVSPATTYGTAQDGVTFEPLDVTYDLEEIANIVAVYGTNKGGISEAKQADADELVPGHPWSQAQVGRYIRYAEQSDKGANPAKLEAKARKILFRRLSAFEQAEFTSWLWPTHRPFDVVALRFDGDEEFAETKLFHEQHYGIDLVTGEMSHSVRRLWKPGD